MKHCENFKGLVSGLHKKQAGDSLLLPSVGTLLPQAISFLVLIKHYSFVSTTVQQIRMSSISQPFSKTQKKKKSIFSTELDEA